MKARFIGSAAAVVLLAWLWGCGAGDAIRIGKNTQSNKLDIIVYIDGMEAKRNMLKQAAMGHSNYKIKERISTRPKLRVELKNPEDTGRVKGITVNIFKEHQSGYSHQADWIVTDGSQKMMPGQEYDLGTPSGLRVFDFNNAETGGVDLTPGTKYQMNVVLIADQSETAQVFVETR